MFAAAAMSLSSFCVVTNALRLNLFSVRSAAKDRRRKTSVMPDFVQNFAKDDTTERFEGMGAEKQGVQELKMDNHDKEREEKVMEKILNVEGMMCGKCQAHVEKALAGVEGVTGVSVDLEAKKATVTCEGSVADETLCAAVVEAGYEATMA